MANKALFKSYAGKLAATADRVNEAGGIAYGLDAKADLAQYIATGCLSLTFYASAQDQLRTVLGVTFAPDGRVFFKMPQIPAGTNGQVKIFIKISNVASIFGAGRYAVRLDDVIVYGGYDIT